MSRDDLYVVYRNIMTYYARRDSEGGQTTEIVFIWHGREPLLQERELYWEIFADHRRIFGELLPDGFLSQVDGVGPATPARRESRARPTPRPRRARAGVTDCRRPVLRATRRGRRPASQQ